MVLDFSVGNINIFNQKTKFLSIFPQTNIAIRFELFRKKCRQSKQPHRPTRQF